MSDKKGFEEAISNMLLTTSAYFKEYCYYGYIIAQCNVIFDKSLSAPAAVCFVDKQYDLLVNPEMFNPMPLAWRIGILKHECLHILGNHVFRCEENKYDQRKFNYATDCAINQFINYDHLPHITEEDLRDNPNPKNLKVGDPNFIYPNNFPAKTTPVPEKLSAEQYYGLLDDCKMPPNTSNSSSSGNGNGEEDSNGSSSGNGGPRPLQGPVDDHATWEQSKGFKEVKDQVTKKMLEEAFDQASKNRGNIPVNHSEWLTIFTAKSQVDWKKVLRNITGNKKANRKATLLRKNRRTPQYRHIKGHIKNRIFELLVVSDVSGSVSSKELSTAWSEIINICKLTSTPVKLIQVDSKAYPPIELKSTTKALNREGCGGTLLRPAITVAKEHKLQFNACVVITDGYIDNTDIQTFSDLGVPIIWLITAEGEIKPGMQSKHMVAMKLK